MTPELFALKGRCQVMDGHFSDALRSFDRALKEKPSLRGVRLMKGMILQSKRDFKGALAMYDEALKEGEDLEAVSGIKAALLYEQERNAELLVFRSDAAKMKRRSYDVDGFVGLVYMQRTPHDDKNGMDYLETAMSAGSQNVEFYIAAVRSYLTDERCYAALSAAEAGLCAIPSSRELFALKAEVLYQLGKYDAAELNAGTLLSEDPEDARLAILNIAAPMGAVLACACDGGRVMADQNRSFCRNVVYAVLDGVSRCLSFAVTYAPHCLHSHPP